MSNFLSKINGKVLMIIGGVVVLIAIACVVAMLVTA